MIPVRIRLERALVLLLAMTPLPILAASNQRADAHSVRFVGQDMQEVSDFVDFVDFYSADLTP